MSPAAGEPGSPAGGAGADAGRAGAPTGGSGDLAGRAGAAGGSGSSGSGPGSPAALSGDFPRRSADLAHRLREMHLGRAAGDPLVLPGPWDAASARVFADAGFAALATPSAGVSASLGYVDGQTPAAEMFAAIARITRAVDVPVSADIEAGYGLPAAELVERLLEAGAVGCNLEDSDPATGRLTDPREQAERLAAVRAVAGDALVINARIDTYLRGAGDRTTAAAVERALLYAEAGVDCVYPITCPPEVLPALAEQIPLPINALCRPGVPSPRELGVLGATRVTFGGSLHTQSLHALQELAPTLRQ